MDPDRSLFDWLGHYLGLIVLSSLFGVGAALAFVGLASPPFEAWSVIIQSVDRISARELGPLAQAVFVTDDVYGPAMQELGIEMDPQRFLSEHAELRPVPDTDALIVIGRSHDPDEAQRISDAMMRSLVRTFRLRNLSEFTVFDQASPVQRETAPPVSLAFGGMIGFWVGLAAAVIHFRARRPILSLMRAVALSAPEHVVTIRGRRPRWLGALRRPRVWRDDHGNRAALERLAARMPAGSLPVVTVIAPQADGQGGLLEETLATRRREGAARQVLVVDAGSGEETLAALPSGAERDEALDLVWVS